MLLKSLLVMVAAVGAATASDAATINFSYIGTNGVLTGQINGVLQTDHNTIFVNGITAAFAYTGSPASSIALPFLDTAAHFLGGDGSGQATVTLDGSVQDLLACNTSVCIDGFALASPTSMFGGAAYIGGPTYGGELEPYVQGNWSMTGSVPEPASWAMMIAGFGLIGGAMRRRAAATA
jgi:hypothetical protein